MPAVIANYTYKYLKPASTVFTLYRATDTRKPLDCSLRHALFFSAPLATQSASLRATGAAADGTARNVLVAFTEPLYAQELAQRLDAHVLEVRLRDHVQLACVLRMASAVVMNSYCSVRAGDAQGDEHFEIFYRAAPYDVCVSTTCKYDGDDGVVA